MGVKIEILDEIMARLESAIVPGGELEAVRLLRLGSVEEARKEIDFPIINIQLTGGDERANRPNAQFSDDLSIQITLIHNKLTGKNSLYNKETQTGALYLFERLLNVIEKKTDGTADNTLNGTAAFLQRKSYSVDENTSQIIITLNLGVQSKAFAFGSR